MKCIGGKDYYDGVSAYDQTIVFDRRHTNTIYNPFSTNKLYSIDRFIDSYSNHTPIQILFCGKKYGGIAVNTKGVHKFFYNYNEYYREYKEAVNYYDTRIWYSSQVYISDLFSIVNCEEFCIESKITVGVSHYFTRNDYHSSFGGLNTKHYDFIAVEDNKNKSMLLYNFDNLKSLDFAKVVDPYQANQEIERWISGVITNAGNPTVNISDESKITKYGFDKKISFRHPTKIKV